MTKPIYIEVDVFV